jgi:protein-tyrosine-phosphatase
VDLSGHRSQIITEELIRDADLIFTFDEQNCQTVLSRFPLASGRVFGLGLLGSRSPSGIDDPYGRQEAGFEVIYAQIAEAIDDLSANLRSDGESSANACSEFVGDSA